MNARDELFRRIAGAYISEERANDFIDAYRAQVLTEEAAELKAHCPVHNDSAPHGFMDCPCRVADELLRRVKVAGRGE